MRHKKHIKYRLLALSLAFALSGGSLLLKTVQAAGGSIALSPNSVSLANGATTTVTVVANTNGVAISTADIALTYDASKLQVVSITPVGLTEGANYANNGSGTIQGGAYKSAAPFPVGGTLLSVTFKAKVGTGSAALQLSTAGAYGTEVDNADGSGSLNLPLAGGSVNFTQPACPSGYTGTYPNCVAPPTCPSGYSGTYPNCVAPKAPTGGGTTGGSTSSTGSTTNKGTPPTTGATTTPTGTGSSTGGAATNTPSGGGTTTPPTTQADGSTVATKQVQFTDAVITSTSKVPTQVYIAYGTDNKSLVSQTDVSPLATTHDVSLDSATLTPGQTYYYMVVSKDAQGNVTKSAIQSFTTKGLNLTILVLDANHKPVANKQVTLHSIAYNAKTNAQGQAVFQNVTPGSHELTYATSKTTYTQKLAVTNNIVTASDGTQTAQPQNFSIVYNITQTSHVGTTILVGVLLVLLVVGAAAVLLFPDEVRRRLAASTSKQVTGPALTTQPIAVAQPSVVSDATPAFVSEPVPARADLQPGSVIAPQVTVPVPDAAPSVVPPVQPVTTPPDTQNSDQPNVA